MPCFRSKWNKRFVVVLMATSLLPVVLAPAARADCSVSGALCAPASDLISVLVGYNDAQAAPDDSPVSSEGGLEARIPLSYAVWVVARGINLDTSSRSWQSFAPAITAERSTPIGTYTGNPLRLRLSPRVIQTTRILSSERTLGP